MNEFNEKEIKEEYLLKTLSEEDNDYWKDYNYGKTIEKLKIGREVKGSVGGGLVYCGTGSRTTVEGTGTQAITGVGFKPKAVNIISRGPYVLCRCDSYTDGTNIQCYYQEGTSGNNNITNSYFIYLRDTSGSKGIAQLSSLDADGFTLNWTLLNSSIDFIYQCYG